VRTIALSYSLIIVFNIDVARHLFTIPVRELKPHSENEGTGGATEAPTANSNHVSGGGALFGGYTGLHATLGKDQRLIATSMIPKGTCILFEPPIFKVLRHLTDT